MKHSISIIIACLSVSFSACGAANKGFDRALDKSNVNVFMKSCEKAYTEMKDANPKEFNGIKNSGNIVFDFSQPKDREAWSYMGGITCRNLLENISNAAIEDNIDLNTIREFIIWRNKRKINESIKDIERHKNNYTTANSPQNINIYRGYMQNAINQIKISQELLLLFSGKSYGPENIDMPARNNQ